MKKMMLSLSALSLGLAAVAPAGVADAQGGRGGLHRAYRDAYRDGYNRDGRYYRGYDSYRARQKCKDGDGGTIVGAIAGGLLGRAIDTRGSRVTGTILGAAGGALAGRAIDRSDRPGYCR